MNNERFGVYLKQGAYEQIDFVSQLHSGLADGEDACIQYCW